MLIKAEYVNRSQSYRAIVKKLEDDTSDDIKIEGQHLSGKTNNQVQSMEIRNIELFKVPGGIGAVFNFIKTLWLEECNIHGIVREDFRNFKRLRELKLGKNQIQVLNADVFSEMPNLTYLSLAHNLLTAIDPHVFDSLRKLNKLNLQHNSKINAVFSDIADETNRQRALKEIIFHCPMPDVKPDVIMVLPDAPVTQEISDDEDENEPNEDYENEETVETMFEEIGFG
jgi:hypothetical protein